MKHGRAGFTLIEVLVAVTLLSVGVVALAGSAGMVTRMIGRGKMGTRAAQLASQRFELLRLAAYRGTPHCTHATFAAGGPVTSALGVTETWTIAGTAVRTVTETVSYRTANGVTHSDVFTTQIRC
jgi:prepilin-type N-terminal cleavage/methylation domain-containing protein